MTATWPFIILAAVNLIVVVYAWRATRKEASTQHDQVAFDLAVEYGITALGFLMLAAVGIADPTLLAVAASVPGHVAPDVLMATGTVIAFAAISTGRVWFLILRRRGQQGSHPFQGSLIQTVAELGKDESA